MTPAGSHALSARPHPVRPRESAPRATTLPAPSRRCPARPEGPMGPGRLGEAATLLWAPLTVQGGEPAEGRPGHVAGGGRLFPAARVPVVASRGSPCHGVPSPRSCCGLVTAPGGPTARPSPGGRARGGAHTCTHPHSPPPHTHLYTPTPPHSPVHTHPHTHLHTHLTHLPHTPTYSYTITH